MNILSKVYRFGQRWPVRIAIGLIVGVGIFAYLQDQKPVVQTAEEAAQSKSFVDSMADGTPLAAQSSPAPAQTVVPIPASEAGAEIVHTSDTAPAPATSAVLDACVTGWVNAYHAEQQAAGNDDTVSQDQSDEWEGWCKEGKQAPSK